MKILFPFFLLAMTIANAWSQTDWTTWNNNYPKTDLKKIIEYEKAYADSVDKGLIKGNYYVRIDKYRFYATFTGEKRKIPADVKSSMIRVFKLTLDIEYLPTFKKNNTEYKFIVDGSEYWFPVQKVLEKPIKKELIKEDRVLLYCLFMNEHCSNGTLYNCFLISEFRKMTDDTQE